MSTGALEAVDRVVNRGGEPDDVLRATVSALVERGACTWAGIRFDAKEGATTGPQAGVPQPTDRTHAPIRFGGASVAELAADGCRDAALLERVALLISPYCRGEGKEAR